MAAEASSADAKKDAAAHKNKPSLFDATYGPPTSPKGGIFNSEASAGSAHGASPRLSQSGASPRLSQQSGPSPRSHGPTHGPSPRSLHKVPDSLPPPGGSGGATPRNLGAGARPKTSPRSSQMPGPVALPTVSSANVPAQSSTRPHTVDPSGGATGGQKIAMASDNDQKKQVSGESGMVSTWAAEDKKRNAKSDPDAVVDVVALSKKLGLPMDDVHKYWDEFRALDTKGKGCISFEEFEQTVRRKCNIPPDDDIPPHLLDDQCKKIGIGSWIKFEAYLSWAVATAFLEEIMVPDHKIRHLRKLARNFNMPYDDLERIKAVFDHYDEDLSGVIDMGEFRQVLMELIHKGSKANDLSQKAVRRYFKEVDADCNGQVDFEEFIAWFLNVSGQAQR